MSPSVIRSRTLRAYNAALERHGREHPAAWAAWARCNAAWGPGRVPQPYGATLEDTPAWRAVTHAYTTADLRARGSWGWSNRAMRRWSRRRPRITITTPEGHTITYRPGSIAHVGSITEGL